MLLDVKDLRVQFPSSRGLVKAVNGLTLSANKGEILGIVGESGSGKSMSLLSMLRLVPKPGEIVSGEINFNGDNLLKKSDREMRMLRGKDISMVFQDPMTTLNPVFPVGEQIREALRIHGLIKGERKWFFSDRKDRERERVLELMAEVGIPSPDLRYLEYPHQFSGGMQQRALIAIALAGEPQLLLADEPTTALDVTIQAQILELLNRINEEHGTTIILVTHDLGVAAEFTHRMVVMYAGLVLEQGPTRTLVEEPAHPYTQGLLNSIPRIEDRRKKIEAIPGTVPDLINMPPGCPFHQRCKYAKRECIGTELEMIEVDKGHQVRCILYT